MAPATGNPSVAASAAATVGAVLRAVAKSVFWGSSGAELLNASAVFLLVFMVVHAIGNSVIFAGAETFNLYGYVLNSSSAIWLVEWYLVAGFGLHAAVAIYNTIATGRYKSVLRNPADFKVPIVVMSVSGSVLLGFLYVHLYDFRFYEDPRGVFKADVVDPFTDRVVSVKNLHRLALHNFATLPNCALYAAANLAIGAHMVQGWRRAVTRPSFALAPEHHAVALAIGNALVAFICGVFTVVPITVYLGVHGEAAVAAG